MKKSSFHATFVLVLILSLIFGKTVLAEVSTSIDNIGPLKIQVDSNDHYNWNEIGRIKVTLENRSSNKLRNIKLTNILPDGLAYATPEWKSGDIKLSLKPNEKKVIYIPVITGKATYKNNMRVTVSTDKQRYEKTDVATLTVRTDNFYDEIPIDNIKIQNFLSYGLEYVENQQPSLYISRLNPGTQQINCFKVRRQDDGDPSGLPQTGDPDENVHIFVAILIFASIGLLMIMKRKGAWK